MFKNEKKQNENQPDYNVSVSFEVNGQWKSHNIGAGWIKESKSGIKYISFKINDKPFTKNTGEVVPAYELKAIEIINNEPEIPVINQNTNTGEAPF